MEYPEDSATYDDAYVKVNQKVDENPMNQVQEEEESPETEPKKEVKLDSEELASILEQGDGYIRSGVEALGIDRDNDALDYFQCAGQLFEPVFGHESVQVARVLNCIGSVHNHRNNVDLALKNYFESLEILRKIFDRSTRRSEQPALMKSEADVLQNIAGIYFSLGNIHI